jgi:hypothetical protein
MPFWLHQSRMQLFLRTFIVQFISIFMFVFLALGIFLSGYFYIIPLFQNVQSSRKQIEHLVDQIDHAKKNQKQYEIIQQNIAKFKTKIDDLIDCAYSSAQVSSALVSVMHAQKIACQDAQILPSIEKDGLMLCPVVIQVQGAFRNIFSFVQQLETTRQPAFCYSIVLSKNRNYMIDLQAKFYLVHGRKNE